jgi:hypothetical protein
MGKNSQPRVSTCVLENLMHLQDILDILEYIHHVVLGTSNMPHILNCVDACTIICGYILLTTEVLGTLGPNGRCIGAFSRSFKKPKILVGSTWLPTIPTATLGEIALLLAFYCVVTIAIVVVPSFNTILSISSLVISTIVGLASLWPSCTSLKIRDILHLKVQISGGFLLRKKAEALAPLVWGHCNSHLLIMYTSLYNSLCSPLWLHTMLRVWKIVLSSATVILFHDVLQRKYRERFTCVLEWGSGQDVHKLLIYHVELNCSQSWKLCSKLGVGEVKPQN